MQDADAQRCREPDGSRPSAARSARERFLKTYLSDLGRDEPRPLSEYLALFPGSEAEIAAEYRLLEDEEGDVEIADASDTAADRQRSEPTTGETIGRYRILRELGHGGQAGVYLAHDPERGEDVALKVMRASRFGLDASGSVKRLRREAALTARLDHPGICEVLDLGEDRERGLVWVAMGYVEGETLATLIARTAGESSGSPSVMLPVSSEDAAGSADTGASPKSDAGARESVRRVLELVEKIARALHVAHEAGLIHRDIKPANVIVREDGQPVILDFGMAREETTEGHSLTLSGDLLGTPYYMSPEQLLAKRVRLDRRTDVYSLGVTLYECLTLRCPFEADSREALYQMILTEPQSDPARFNRHLPRKVKTVLDTALEKNRERRYPTALAFAEDLRRLRHSQPIAARRLPWTLRLTRWSQRNPAAATFVAVLSVALIVTFLLLREVSREQANTQIALDAVAGKNVELRAVERAARLRQVAESIATERVEIAARRATLVSIPEEHRGFAWRWLSQRCDDLQVSMPHRTTDGFGRSVDLHPDGNLYAAVLVRAEGLWEDAQAPNGVFSAEGRVIFGAIEPHQLTPDEERWLDRQLPGSAFVARFTPSGRLVTGDTHTRAVTLWDAESTAPVVRRSHGARVLALSVARDGTVASAGEDGSVRVWEANTLDPRPLPALESYGAPIRAIDLSPDASRLVIAGDTGEARILDARTGASIRELTYGRQSVDRWVVPPVVHDAAFAPDGDLVALAGDDLGRVALFDARDGGLIHDLRPHVQETGGKYQSTGVAFDPSGRWLISSGTDGHVRLHSVTAGRPLGSILMRNRVWALAVPKSSRWVVATSNEGGYWKLARGQVSAWGLDALPLPLELVGHVPSFTWDRVEQFTVSRVVTTRDGRYAYSLDEQSVRKWDLTTGRQLFAFRDSWLVPLGIALHPDEQELAVGGQSGRGKILDASTGGVRAEFELPRDVRRPRLESAVVGMLSLCYSPDGEFLAVGPGSWDARQDPDAPAPVLLFDARTGTLRHRLVGHTGSVMCVVFSRDGTRLISVKLCQEASEMRFWNLESRAPTAIGRPVPAQARICAVNPADGLVWVQTSNRTISSFDPRTGERTVDVPFAHGDIQDLHFHRSGKEVIVTTSSGTAIWDVPMRNQLLALPIDRPYSLEARTRFCGDRGIVAVGGLGFATYYGLEPGDREHFAERGTAWRAARVARAALLEHWLVDAAAAAVAADEQLDDAVRDAALEILAATTEDWQDVGLEAWRGVAPSLQQPGGNAGEAVLMRAEELARAALPGARPDSFQEAVYHAVLGIVLYQRGKYDASKYEDALEHLEIGTGMEHLRATALCAWHPQHYADYFVVARAHLAMTCHALGLEEEAREHLQVAKEKNSGNRFDAAVVREAERVLGR